MPVGTSHIKEVLISSLGLEGMTPEMIGDEDPLFENGLGLDSVDALEIVVALEQAYDISIRGREIDRAAFESVSSLQRLVNDLAQDRAQ